MPKRYQINVLWYTWGVSCRSGLGSRYVSDWCRPSQGANCLHHSSSLSTGSLKTHAGYMWTQDKCKQANSVSTGQSCASVYCIREGHRCIQYPSSPVGHQGWIAGVHGRASPAVGTGWPTDLVASPVKESSLVFPLANLWLITDVVSFKLSLWFSHQSVSFIALQLMRSLA